MNQTQDPLLNNNQQQQQYYPPQQNGNGQPVQGMPMAQQEIVVVQQQSSTPINPQTLSSGPIVLKCNACGHNGQTIFKEESCTLYSCLWCLGFGLIGLISYNCCSCCRENHQFEHHCSRCGNLITKLDAKCC